MTGLEEKHSVISKKNTLPPPRNITRDKSVSIAPVTLPPAKDTKYIT